MRYYTVDEARAVLPTVITIVQRLRDAYVELRAMQATFLAHQRGASGDGNLLADPWADEAGPDRSGILTDQMENAARELDELGIELKDPARGLIDFFSLRDGEVVYLCYLLGEPALLYWHTLDGGFARRQLL